MKLLLSISTLIITLLFNTSFAQAAQPEKVHSIIKVYKTYEWYVEQYGLWEMELKKDKKNGEIWENIYAAARMAKIMAAETTDRDAWFSTMGEVITRMEKTIPKTYQYYHLKSWNSSIWGSTGEEVKEISSWAEKAYALDPNRTEIYPDLMNAYMIEGDTNKIEELSKKWLASGDISPNLLALTYNMLNSTNQNATLLTAGDNDTYPALVLQYGAGIRRDISIINIYCAYGSAEYRNHQLKKAAITTTTTEMKDQLALVHYIVENREESPLYFAYGNYASQDSVLNKNMYNVGLALRYSEEAFNNTSDIINNFENKFLLDHLTFSTSSEQFPEQVKRHNLTYLPGLFILFDHYVTIQDTRKQEQVKKIIQTIAAGTPHAETAKNRFKDC
ncbi:MAG: hypothetical protein ACI8ZM_000054 [Crocinitomix sp.]|jgi:hypothetical protein